ncbi:MAG: GAF domain-containing protein, partial [Acidobacteria bacterium]
MSHEDRLKARDERAPGPRSAVHASRATAGQRVMNDERPTMTEGRSTVKEPAVTDEVLRGMRAMVEAFRQVSGALSLQETLEAILDGLRALLEYDAAGLYVSDPETGRLKHYAVRGYSAGVSQTELVSKGERLLRRVMDAAAPMLIADVASDRRYIEARASTRSEIAVPIMGSGGRVIGLLNLESDRKDTYDPLSLELVRVFASGVAAAIERAILHAEMMAARRLETELAIARSVMEGILPPTTPRWEGF